MNLNHPTLPCSFHLAITKELYDAPNDWSRAAMPELKQKFDASTVAIMRQALSEVVSDHRFSMRKSVTRLEVAEHILEQAASGVRDLDRLKNSAFEKLSATA
jgi:hypothetical protein